MLYPEDQQLSKPLFLWGLRTPQVRNLQATSKPPHAYVNDNCSACLDLY